MLPLRRARDRLPWLLAGLAGSVLATRVVAAFEHALTRRVAIAFFVPAIVDLADAFGTQTEAIAVRGLSLSHAPMRTLVWGQLRTGLVIGAVVSAIAWTAIFGGLRNLVTPPPCKFASRWLSPVPSSRAKPRDLGTASSGDSSPLARNDED